MPLTYHELFLNAEKNTFFLEGQEPASFEEIKEFIEEAILDSKIVNSSQFLRRAVHFFKGSKDVLPEQKKCIYPYYSIQFDASGRPTPCLTGCQPSSAAIGKYCYRSSMPWRCKYLYTGYKIYLRKTHDAPTLMGHRGMGFRDQRTK